MWTDFLVAKEEYAKIHTDPDFLSLHWKVRAHRQKKSYEVTPPMSI